MNRFSARHCCVLLCCGLGLPASAKAAWLPGGFPFAVSTLTPQVETHYPEPLADGQAGLWIAWDKFEDVFPSTYPAVNRITPAGDLSPMLPAGGVLTVPPGPGVSDGYSAIAPDEEGGVFVLFEEQTRTTATGLRNVLLTRLGPNGVPIPGWGAGGRYVTHRPSQEGYSSMCSDGAGGVIVSWLDNESNYVGLDLTDIRLQRISSDGSHPAGWPSDSALVVAPGLLPRYLIALVSDGAHGAYVVWYEEPASQSNPNEYVSWVIVQHYTGDGQVAPGWPATGIRASDAGLLEHGFTAIADGEGGLVLAWADSRSEPPGPRYYYYEYADIYATRFRFDGTRAPGWPAEGTVVSVAPGEQREPWLCPDGTGGALIAWGDSRAGYAQLYANRILGTGERAPGWPANGMVASDISVGAESIRLQSDAMGGAFIGWDNEFPQVKGYVQHLRGDGTIAQGWSNSGVGLVVTPHNRESWIRLAPAEPGNAFVTWENVRFDPVQDTVSLRVQKLLGDGPVPVHLALVTATASPDAVQLEWRGDRAAFTGARVERSGVDGAWQPLGAPVHDGADILRFEDHSIVAGARYAYRLVDASGKVLVAPTWVDVPAATRFALAGATPNPSRAGDLAVRFSLPVRASGTLELLDLAGRRRAYRELGAMEPGEHLERMAETAGFAPGLYWLHLQQGGKSATSRVALTP